ncbi:hypothetical protein HPP92_001001 [Vanilla planifolia]|uniref:MADS-box domain-containing protein n=1 Tax=Vanilla planifolia TaxID=51239 RepID=A0A835RZ40_VANPL|nr:hypothetical protein HPP92_001001 [Vanilla planifolia]
MARKKVSLSLIANEATRRATLKKRRKGLMKKVKELSILCDVRACAIVYSPQEAQPEVWPSVAEATRLLTRFRSMPEMEQSKKMLNQETFLRQRVAKLHEQLRRHERENRELESAALLRECLAASGGGVPSSGCGSRSSPRSLGCSIRRSGPCRSASMSSARRATRRWSNALCRRRRCCRQR